MAAFGAAFGVVVLSPAGGGLAASAWELGLITGMADAGLDVRNADRFVGTSAGALFAALTGGYRLDGRDVIKIALRGAGAA